MWFLWAKQCIDMAGRDRKHDMLGASCAEPSEARLRAADGSMIGLITIRASKVRDDAGDLQNASLL